MSSGILYILATPIGNMEDITFRAVRLLRENVDVVYCEDTRQTRKLLSHYGISVPALSLHTHSSPQKIEGVIDLIKGGKSIAYATDSGTPGLSDPGSRLVSAAREQGIPVCPVPGPSALAAIVSVSGYHGKSIIFGGFLSKKEGRRKKELAAFREFNGIIVLYESPYRIKKLIVAIGEVFPGRMLLIGREMTKLHEEFIYGKVDEIISAIDSVKEKGEFSVIVYNDIRDYNGEPDDDTDVT
ncbi:MAG TPA: 16S rRNA (cytidine(1402)-2'-O)-methyltransferase [Spirochaetota bacterium]|nr:16S rRNA (cytidine(1402)-2'-O)-methyltransferase [Spirochaetota bacterium]HPC40593.1 16S rRNA (cytidine(1402)-2'-O)-methyltransferase [Spirochaetota bacterium]HQF07899.1 16S rRNA (cytidine(1402)-2'-O)-methyltransferase [Spirochaetota bacterium]HQH96458.1 16S rRNA (cytidine(1402)-2'-O)-methyltransferase [Spirochaetota bacterium]